MFNNDSWLKYQEQIGLKAKELEELIAAQQTQLLTKGMTLDKAEWELKQRANVQRLQKLMTVDIVAYQKEMHRIAEEGLAYAIKTSTNDLVHVVENVDAVKQTSELTMKVGIDEVKKKISSDLAMLYTSALNDFRSNISNVVLDNRNLFDTVKSVIEKKATDGFVMYSGGRKVSVKAYLEMSVRTELSRNAQYNLEQSSKAAGVQFYIASQHADSAEDHADFQGYYYLADGVQWKEEYSQYHFHPKYKYLSEVKALGFLTRPNCRHFVQPVTFEQLKNPDAIRNKLHMPNEKYQPKKYDALVEQRKNERAIRQYKSKVQNEKLMLSNLPTTDIEGRKALEASIKRNNSKVREWSLRQKTHIEKNGLTRERIRERPNIIVNDLGARRSMR